MRLDDTNRRKIEQEESWRDWAELLPNISFPSSWSIRFVPPFAGALVRFYVTSKKTGGFVSVYLDVFERLGVEKSYWEVYPSSKNGKASRCSIDDTKTLLKLIKEGLNYK